MKKITAFALTFVFIMALISGCGKGPEEKVFSKSGLSITLNVNFEDVSGTEGTQQYTAAFLSEEDSVGVLVLKEDFATFEAVGVSTEISLSEYAQFVIDANREDCAIIESGGLTYFEYERGQFTYFSTVFRGSDAYWIVQFYTSTDDYAKALDNFKSWAKTVVV